MWQDPQPSLLITKPRCLHTRDSHYAPAVPLCMLMQRGGRPCLTVAICTVASLLAHPALDTDPLASPGCNSSCVNTLTPGAAPRLGKSVEDVMVGGRRFRWFEAMTTWDAAQANCKKLGGNLATADTQAISDALIAAYNQGLSSWWVPSLSPGAWIGLRTANGDFSSCPWEYTWVANGRKMGEFTGFRRGSPTGSGGCVLLKPAEQRWPYGFGEWVGYPCSSPNSVAPSFCEL
jgi:hypothetical protein